MRLINQRGDIDMGRMPTQLIAGPGQISVAAPPQCGQRNTRPEGLWRLWQCGQVDLHRFRRTD